MNSKLSTSEDRAVQIIKLESNAEFRAKKSVLLEIYNDERVADLPLVVVCIAGAARKGKSFILNFFLDYLNHMEKHPTETWVLNDNTKLTGFEFQEGEDPTTMGIWAWSHVFVIEQENGRKICFTLIDSQGTFDKNTGFKTCSTIFALTCTFSSIMCFNVFTDLQEDKLSTLAVFVEHAKRIFDNLGGGSGKVFQDLAIIVRDFCHKKYLDDKNGGQKYVENSLGIVKVDELQSTRDGLNESYERLFGFIFPNPGKKVSMEKTTAVQDIDPEFVERAKEMVEKLLSQAEAKSIGPTVLRSKNMTDYILQNVKCFNENQEFAPQAVQIVNRNLMINLEVSRAVETYNKNMDEAFLNRKTGFEERTLDDIHNETFAKISQDVENHIKNKEILAEVMDKFGEHMTQSFFKYYEKNELLVEVRVY
uniref:GB1/RHD3-type G domain-containing protein n=1 Tax=Panagrolaimus davidi TaxID=227884 RepID=A0A914P4T1_9BILA